MELKALVNNDKVTNINGIPREEILRDYKKDPDLAYARCVEGELRQAKTELAEMSVGSKEFNEFNKDLTAREEAFGKFLNPPAGEEAQYRTNKDKPLDYDPLPQNKAQINEIRNRSDNPKDPTGSDITSASVPVPLDSLPSPSLSAPTTSAMVSENLNKAEYHKHGGTISPAHAEKITPKEEIQKRDLTVLEPV